MGRPPVPEISEGNWRVVIVEDDPAVATIHRTIVGRTPGFDVASVASNAEAALTEIGRTKAHLVLLDLTLRGADGVTLARRLRAAESDVEIIPVTASRDAAVVRSLVHLGVVDYLVKPFTPERLQQALVAFSSRVRSLPVGPGKLALTQEAVDRATGSAGLTRTWLPKGVNSEVLGIVRSTLAREPTSISAAAVAKKTGRSRVTVRRYLEYLVTTKQAEVHSLTRGPGRPTKVYRLVDTSDLQY